MKKPKTLEVKLRSAIRLIWSRSKERREILKQANTPLGTFLCPVCKKDMYIQMAEVDHIEPVGVLELDHLTEWVKKMFFGPQRAICKLCHKKKTAMQRRKCK